MADLFDIQRALSESFEPDAEESREEVFSQYYWIKICTEFFISVLIAFGVFYLISLVNEVANHNLNPNLYEHLLLFNNFSEFVVLTLCVVAMICALTNYRWNHNHYSQIPFDNISMVIVMGIIVVLEVCFYTLMFVEIFAVTSTNDYVLTLRVFINIAELTFMVTILPFSIIFSYNTVLKTQKWLQLRLKIAISLSMISCLLIFLKRISLKICDDVFPQTYNANDSKKDLLILHNNIFSYLYILELFDINYVLIGFIIMIHPLIILTKSINFDQSFTSESKIQRKFSILESLSLMRYRVVTIIFGLLLLSFLVLSVLISGTISNSQISLKYNQMIYNIFMLNSGFTYFVAIIYTIYYILDDVVTWEDSKELYWTMWTTDQYFNFIGSILHLIYSSFIIVNIFTVYLSKELQKNPITIAISVTNFFLLYIQILSQMMCLHLASKKIPKPLNDTSTWKFKLIPPLMLAILNMGFLFVTLEYSQYDLFNRFQFQNYNGTTVILKDILLPVTVLHRLYAMIYFVNMTRKQWYQD